MSELYKTADAPPDSKLGAVLAFHITGKQWSSLNADYVASNPEEYRFWMPLPDIPVQKELWRLAFEASEVYIEEHIGVIGGRMFFREKAESPETCFKAGWDAAMAQFPNIVITKT